MACLTIGCGRNAPTTQPVEEPTSRPVRPVVERIGGGSQPLRTAPQNPPTLLAAGKLPVVHLFVAGGRVRIVDATGSRVLATGVAPPNSIVSVTAAGVTVAKQKLVNARLPEDRTYEIWYEPAPAAAPNPAP